MKTQKWEWIKPQLRTRILLPVMSTQEKALAINLDAAKFGTFAEIGAGQEVARWFFHVGHASATVAKSMSAYDMVISDIIYGADRSLRQPRPPGVHAGPRMGAVARAPRPGAR